MQKVEIGKGFVEVIDHLGNDTTVVNAARVSFGKKIKEITDKDIILMQYLASHEHTSPFRHCFVQFHVKAPEFVARQWYKHIIGCEYTFKDTGWNEISGRYVELDPELFEFEELRLQSKDRKQGSSDEVLKDNRVKSVYQTSLKMALLAYQEMLDAGVAKEIARTVLPVSFYTEWWWTASFQAIAHFVRLRKDSHAQKEIRDYAEAIDTLMNEMFPNAWPIFLTHAEK